MQHELVFKAYLYGRGTPCRVVQSCVVSVCMDLLCNNAVEGLLVLGDRLTTRWQAGARQAWVPLCILWYIRISGRLLCGLSG